MMLFVLSLIICSPCFAKPFSLKLDESLNFINYNPKALFEQLPGYGKSWMYFPDGNGIPQIAQLNITSIIPRANNPISQNVEFHLYTRANPNDSQIIEPDDSVSPINATYFDPKKPTKMVSHGWTSSYKSDTSQLIKDNFLEREDCNVILINWEKIASNILYPISAMETKNVGNYVGEMIDYLIENGANLKDFHLIGHSLGAHVVGNAGEAIQNGRVKRITGLDPALPGFELIAPNTRKLDPSDADFVDIIHTCGGVLGYYSSLGHVDFYPNGGVPSQPGCFGVPQIIEGCSHGRAWQYFIESIKYDNSFMSIKCNNYEEYLKGDCANNTKIAMGISVPFTAKGSYFLQTEMKPPFARELSFTNVKNNFNPIDDIATSLKKIVPFNFNG